MERSELATLRLMKDNPEAFLDLVKKNKRVLITKHGRFVAVAQSVDSMEEALVAVEGPFELGISPAALFSLDSVPFDVFRMDLRGNFNSLQVNPHTYVLLTHGGNIVMVLQNVVVGVESVLIGMNTELMESLDPEKPRDVMTSEELIAALGIEAEVAAFERGE